MSIPNYDFLTKPIDTDKVKYNKEEHRYILDLDYAIQRTGLGDLVDEMSTDGSNDNALWYLDLVSKVAYDYVRSFKDSKFEKRLTYYLSHSISAREALVELMIDMMVYNQQEGGLFTAYITGINLQEAKNITNISLKTAVGLLGHQIVMNYGLGERDFKYDFDFTLDKFGVDW